MQQPSLACPDCTAPYAADDNYCRSCGMFVAALRDELALTTRPVQTVERYHRERAPLPAPVKRAVTAVAVGAAMQMGLSLATKYLASQTAQKAARTALTAANAANAAPRGRGRAVQPVSQQSGLPDDIAAVAETVIVRRLWVRRP
jgi:hypothetical protein